MAVCCVQPEQLLVVDHVTFPLEQDVQAPIAEAAAFMGDRLHALAKAGIVRPGCLVSHSHAAAADGFTRPPFAHPVGIHEMRHSFPLGRGRHHFFPKRSFKAALSSMASASSRFSRVFSVLQRLQPLGCQSASKFDPSDRRPNLGRLFTRQAINFRRVTACEHVMVRRAG